MPITYHPSTSHQHMVDVRLLKVSMILIFFMFGYAKWFEYEAQALAPLIGHSQLMSWMHVAWGIRGASYALGLAEWSIAILLIAGFCWPRVAFVGACGSALTFATTLTLILSTPHGWVQSAGGFPAMASSTSFLIKDVVLLSVSIVLARHAWIAMLAKAADDARRTPMPRAVKRVA